MLPVLCRIAPRLKLRIRRYLILIFERTTVQSTSNYPDRCIAAQRPQSIFLHAAAMTHAPVNRWMQKFGYAECWWFVWTVYTTVGFGDWTPVTPFGRIMSVSLHAALATRS